jgi:hypothetical protein
MFEHPSEYGDKAILFEDFQQFSDDDHRRRLCWIIGEVDLRGNLVDGRRVAA